MPAKFITTVKPSGGDFTSLAAWNSGVCTNLTPNTIMVFSGVQTSGRITGWQSVTLFNNGSSAGIVGSGIANVAGNQILVKNISSATTYTSGMQWVLNSSNVFTINNTGDSPIASAELYAMRDIAPARISGWTTNATNYVDIYAKDRHTGIFDTGKYRLDGSGIFALGMLWLDCSYVHVEGLQVKNYTVSNHGIFADITVGHAYVTDCLVYGAPNHGIDMSPNGTGYVTNCIAYECGNAGFDIDASTTTVAYFINCVAINNSQYGFGLSGFRQMECWNCYAGGNGLTDFFYRNVGSPTNFNLTNCYSNDGSTGTSGVTKIVALSSTGGARFMNILSGTEDLRLQQNSQLYGSGVAVPAEIWFKPEGFYDIQNNPIGSTWSVGPFDSVVVSGTANIVLWPTGDVSVGGWTVPPLYPHIDSNTNGLDWIASSLNPVNDASEVYLSGISPTGAFSSGVINVQYRKAVNNSIKTNLTVALLQGTTLITSGIFTDIGTNWITTGINLTSQILSSITDYTKLHIRMIASTG